MENNQNGLEEASEKYVREHGYSSFSRIAVDEVPYTRGQEAYKAFLAGAAYVKGGEGLVDELRKANPWLKDTSHGEQGMATVWSDCCNKLQELLNQKEAK